MNPPNIPFGWRLLVVGETIASGDRFEQKTLIKNAHSRKENWSGCYSSVGNTYDHQSDDVNSKDHYVIREIKEETIHAAVENLRVALLTEGHTDIKINITSKVVKSTESNLTF